MENLALIFGNQGRWREAEKLHMQIIETRKRAYGAEDLTTIKAISDLVNTYICQGRWKEAEELSMQLTGIRKVFSRVLGAEHPDTIFSMQELAVTFKDQNLDGEAISLMKKCVQLEKKVLGSQHPDTKRSLEVLNEWLDENNET
ncbi:kinesin light chain [Zopfia rhizophila CBS 207.26]|uniref:Kinesin light chain n=1 Tax=Zopfia rhizophila CBS 207.26 TaxID=1314779 RepID=A0A6A6EJH7_9PEZI|nr:kinesin light chain [Zopfia rhizophila CBS 207.26]